MRKKHDVLLLLVVFALPFLAAWKGEAQEQTRIKAGRLRYDYDASHIVFEDKVRVEDPRFQMTADRAVVSLRDTNVVVGVEASGQVVIVSSNRSARCHKAVYSKDAGSIILFAQEKGVPTRQAYLRQLIDGKNDVLYADRITIWLDSQRVDCSPARIILDGSKPSYPSGR